MIAMRNVKLFEVDKACCIPYDRRAMNIKSLVLTTLAALAPLGFAQQELPVPGDANHAAVTETWEQRNQRMDWWRKARFGMFIHYGLYSGLAGEFQGNPGGGEWIQCNLGLDTDTYAAEAKPLFKPSPSCAEEWATLAEKAGCRYMVLTSKHHEGFALFDTRTTDYSSAHLAGRDIVKEFADAARRHGMRVGLYHSVIDWHHESYDNTICPGLCYPTGQAAMLKAKGIKRDHAAYQKYLFQQVRELLSQYGTIDIIWWDYSQGAAEGERGWKAPSLISLCRELQPGIIMNNRLYAFSGFDPGQDKKELDLRCGDFTTPEKRIPAAGYPGLDWEACMTIGDKWGYSRYDKNLKAPSTIIRQLQECAAKGGNLLLNVGPRADGSIPEGVAEVMSRVGAWMEVNGEAIYESLPLEGVELPEGWLGCVVHESIFLFPPPMAPDKDVTLRLLAYEVDTVAPSVQGQPDCPIRMVRVEEESFGECPAAYMEFTIPAKAWSQAVECMPVIRLDNDR